MSQGTSLQAKYDALHVERARTWEPERLARNLAQRLELAEHYDAGKVVQPGERIEPFKLLITAGGEITLDELTANGPAVLIFFRFAGCPACNIALPHYDQTLRPALEAAGIPLVAISPQVPDRLDEIKTRHGLAFTVASDPDNRLACRLGITFVPGDIPAGPPPAGWIGEVTGTDSWELPQPTVIVLDRGRIVRSIQVSPDWLIRPESEGILDLLRAADVEQAA